MRYNLAIIGFGLAAACGGGSAPMPEPKEAVLRNSSGLDVGRVTLREHGERISVRVRVTQLPAGYHGMHLHAVGRCDGPDFQSAGGHLNPGGQMKHGHKNPQGPHLGDLGNIHVGDDGRGDVTVEVQGAEARSGMRTFLGNEGLAVVIHAAQDDELTDPSGSSGARVACAAIMP